MAEGWVRPSDIVEKLSSQVSSSITVNSWRVLDEDKEREFQRRVAEVEDLLRNRNHYGFWETFSRLLKEKRTLKVGLIHGRSAQVWQDFMSAFRSAAGEYADRIEFVRFESSLSDGELAKTVEEVVRSGVHTVFLLREGWSKGELARVGGFESIKAIIRADIPFYIAIGHSFDRMVSLMEKVADGNFATPSIAGQELGKLVRVVSENEGLKDAAKRKRGKEFDFIVELAVKLLLVGFLLFLGFKVMPYLFKAFVLKQP
jgi:exonuclease VII large subunit